MNAHTPTIEVLSAYRGKLSLLQWWEAQPKDVQAMEQKYIGDLTRRIRQLRVYLEHRKDAPV